MLLLSGKSKKRDRNTLFRFLGSFADQEIDDEIAKGGLEKDTHRVVDDDEEEEDVYSVCATLLDGEELHPPKKGKKWAVPSDQSDDPVS